MFLKRKVEKLIKNTFGSKWKFGTQLLYMLDMSVTCSKCNSETDGLFDGEIFCDYDYKTDKKTEIKCACGHTYTEKELLTGIKNTFPEDERDLKEKMFEFLIKFFIGEEFGNVERTWWILFSLKILFFVAIFVICIHFLIKFW